MGVRYNITHAFFTAQEFAPDQVPDATTFATTHRAGPLISYLFFENPHGLFDAPTLALVANWWLQHPYRAGGSAPGSTSQAIPYVGMAFTFRSNF